MFKKFIIIVMLVTIVSVFASSYYVPQRPDKGNGHTWQGMTEQQKFYFVAGIMAAGNNFAELMAFFAEKETQYNDLQKVKEMVRLANNYYNQGNLDTLILSYEISGQF